MIHIVRASNGYLNWEKFRNRILYTLNEDTTFYYKTSERMVNNMCKVFKLIVDESTEPVILEEDEVLEDILIRLESISHRIDDIQCS